VFSIRVTDDERKRLEAQHAKDKGPRALGRWLVWRASSGTTRAARVLPARAGITPPARQYPKRSRAPEREPKKRVILDLCAGSGSWSEPYVRAGYKVIRVSLPELDVRTWKPPRHVWGVLAAPPCDQFSLARQGHGRRVARPDFVRGMEVVNACMRIVQQCRPQWWALENPVGHLSKFLGTPRDTWEPFEFGDPWTKRTAIWGDFELPKRGPFVKPRGAGPPCSKCGDIKRRQQPRCSNPAHRAITPAGFARAFFEANP